MSLFSDTLFVCVVPVAVPSGTAVDCEVYTAVYLLSKFAKIVAMATIFVLIPLQCGAGGLHTAEPGEANGDDIQFRWAQRHVSCDVNS